ncbi:hypothetical protein BDR22DRAFT_895349 [Usnea florida]
MATSIEPLAPGELQKLLNGPAVAPPAGIISNLENPPNIDTVCYLTFYLCLSCATLAVVMRIYTKQFLIHAIAYEDYASVIGLVGLWGLFIPSLFAQRSGAGIHAWDLSLRAFSRTIYWFDTAVIIYLPGVFFIKLSILLQYLRIFVPNRKGNLALFVAVQICIWSIFSYSVIYLFLNIFMCDPREKLWDPLISTGHCYNTSASWESSGILNVVSDFAILLLPMPCLWRLQIPMRNKILIMGVFATGLLACVTSIVRTYYTYQISRSSDETYKLQLMGLWGWAELTIGIIVGCLPVMPKLFHDISARIAGPLSSRSKYGVTAKHGLMNRTETPKANAFTKVQRPFANQVDSRNSESSTDLYSPQVRLHGNHLTADRYDSLSLNGSSRHEPIHPPSVLIATRRGDLEYGENTI